MGLILVAFFADQQQWGTHDIGAKDFIYLTFQNRFPERKESLPADCQSSSGFPARGSRSWICGFWPVGLEPAPQFRSRTGSVGFDIPMGVLGFRHCI